MLCICFLIEKIVAAKCQGSTNGKYRERDILGVAVGTQKLGIFLFKQ